MAFFNPFRPAYIEDPYPALHRLRETDPVFWSKELDAWVLTRYEDCLRVLQDENNFSSNPANARGQFGAEVIRKRTESPLGDAPIMGNSDSPQHTRLRAIVNRGFTPRVIEAMRPGIEQACDELLTEWPPGTPLEVMAGLAEPLAVTGVLAHLGIPREGFGLFRQCSLALMRARAEGGGQPGVIEAATAARGELLDFLAGLARSRETEASEMPPDVLSVLLDACEEEALTPDEMLMMLIHISLAGNGPTAMAIGNAVLALAQHPEVLAWLARNPDAVPAAVEELLRFDSSTHFVVRFALADAKFGARTIKAGQQIHAMVGAANRDPARFPAPDTLDLARTNNRHLSFGYGVHFCLGAPLARLELEIAVRKLLAHSPGFGVLELIRGGTYQVRGPQRLLISASN